MFEAPSKTGVSFVLNFSLQLFAFSVFFFFLYMHVHYIQIYIYTYVCTHICIHVRYVCLYISHVGSEDTGFYTHWILYRIRQVRSNCNGKTKKKNSNSRECIISIKNAWLYSIVYRYIHIASADDTIYFSNILWNQNNLLLFIFFHRAPAKKGLIFWKPTIRKW